MITNGLKDKAVYILVENLLQKMRKSVAEIRGLPKRQRKKKSGKDRPAKENGGKNNKSGCIAK